MHLSGPGDGDGGDGEGTRDGVETFIVSFHNLDRYFQVPSILNAAVSLENIHTQSITCTLTSNH